MLRAMKRKSENEGAPHCAAMLAALEGRVSEAAALLRSQYQAMELKRLYRQGWLKRGIPLGQAESVADHSFCTALLALALAGRPPFEGIDRDRALRMALIHELGEVYAGDITPVDGVSADDKHALELASLERVLGGLPAGDELRLLWEDFEEGSSPEARFVRQLDRLEMGLQAAVYRAEGSIRMQEFFDSADRSLSDPFLRDILAEAIRPYRA